jgi:ligand-binding sensor domain-containing protein
MKNSGSLTAIIAVALLGIVVIIAASVQKKPVLVETSAIANPASQTPDFVPPETAAFGGQSLDTTIVPQVTAIVVDGDNLVIGTDDGLYMMPLVTKKTIPPQVVNPEKRELPGISFLNAILPLGDERFIGGNGLYKFNGSYSENLGSYYPGETVNVIMEYGDGLLVGTDHGLWYHCNQPLDETGCTDAFIKPNLVVTALAEDRDGLWVGTYGDGLLYFDGDGWQERYLVRDTFALAFVTALDYSYPNLWVGTDAGIFRFDGGKWAQMFASDSSEEYAVNAILITRAATYIGTEDGLLRYANGSLKAVEEFNGMAIAKLCAEKKDVIVATREDGIYTYYGKEEIVSPEQLTWAMPDTTNTEVLAGTEGNLK